MEFIANSGWYPKQTEDGFIINASGVERRILFNRRHSFPRLSNFLFDPQIYLTDLNFEDCLSTCCNLASYGWMGVDLPPITGSKEEWRQLILSTIDWRPSFPTDELELSSLIKSCLDFQVSIGSNYLIAPSPIIKNSNESINNYIIWLGQVERIKDEYDKPIIMSLPLYHTVINSEEPHINMNLQSILDNITIANIDGLYITVLHADLNNNTRITDSNVLKSLLYISFIMGKLYSKRVIVNFVDDFGLLCLGAGASVFASGFTSKEKCICLTGFGRSFGRAYPKFYSNTLIRDLLPETNLRRVQRSNLLHHITYDITNYSNDMLDALEQGMHLPPRWIQRTGNTNAAEAHRLSLLMQCTRNINTTANINRSILLWLSNAKELSRIFDRTFINPKFTDKTSHIGVWKTVYEYLMGIQV